MAAQQGSSPDAGVEARHGAAQLGPAQPDSDVSGLVAHEERQAGRSTAQRPRLLAAAPLHLLVGGHLVNQEQQRLVLRPAVSGRAGGHGTYVPSLLPAPS